MQGTINVRCTQARKTTHGLDGQHQYVDKTPRGRVSQNGKGHINGESTSMVRPTLGSRTAKEQDRTTPYRIVLLYSCRVYITVCRTVCSTAIWRNNK